MRKVLIEAHYLPSIEYFACIGQFEEVLIEARENFVKQSYRNRCYINIANGVIPLIIPILHYGKKPIKDTVIDYHQPWVKNHWNSIQSAYRKAPFFEFYAENIEKILFKKRKYLFDLNHELLTNCLEVLKINSKILQTQSYQERISDEYFDARSIIHPKKNYKSNRFYTSVSYYQIFGRNFVENLSIIDLLFCVGPEAGYIVSRSSINR